MTVLSNPFAQYVLAAVLLAALGYAVKLLNAAAAYFTAKAADTHADATARARDDVFSHLLRLAATVVSDIEAVERPLLGGKLDATTGAKLKAAAIERVKEYASADGIAEVTGVLGVQGETLDKLIGSLVERAHAALQAPPAGATT